MSNYDCERMCFYSKHFAHPTYRLNVYHSYFVLGKSCVRF
jgi:hypothetical protein